ncbi:MAG: hypothetical protein K9N23_15235 [Akkermansiaceae bacterium]|nr:hypothetical protein [Akkermansiaceae bacterium]
MKPPAILTAILLALPAFAQELKEPVMLVPWQPAARSAPLFFSASADVRAHVSLTEATTEQDLAFRIHQGKPELLSVALGGAGEVLEVTGEGLKDWSVRMTADGSRFLDLRPLLPEARDAKMPEQIQVLVKTKQPLKDGGTASLLLPRQGAATSMTVDLTIEKNPTLDLRVVKAEGMVPVEGRGSMSFVGRGAGAVDVQALPGGLDSLGVELTDTRLTGRLADDANSVIFTLTTLAKAAEAGMKTELCGGAALASGVAGDGWHLALRKTAQGQVYDLIAETPGDLTVKVELVVPVQRDGDWRTLSFQLAGGVVVPVRLAGLPKGAEFNRKLSVVPERIPDQPDQPDWLGFLPAGGLATLAWRTTATVADGELFFSSTETTDVRVGSGLLRQLTVIDLRVLQGKLAGVTFDLTGPGEVLAVTGEGVLGWAVNDAENARQLEVKLNQPITGTGRLVIESQAALAAFPVRAEPLRLTPVGSLRHSGWLRVANDGAVRIEVVDAKGLIQLAPAQFPAGVDDKLRQVFVYRFPSAEHSYSIQADQVVAEVAVTEVTVYELAETDRRIRAELELDIREAPLREWEMDIPADFAVAELSGAAVADYVLVSGTKGKMQRLKVLFKEGVAGRQLISLRLEQNQAAKPGLWELPPLAFPGTKSRRGYVGAVAAPGYRLVPGKNAGVAEIPLSAFPNKADGLQLAFRLREESWQLGLTAESLGQSIQADVFHLYSLKSGAAYGSVLVNYFVVGAPASEWRIAVPAGIGNIEVTGQNVGRDWRREENTLIVPLSRPLLGAGTVLLTFEQPMDPRGGELAPGEVRPLGVQGERGYVQVISPRQVKFSVLETTGPLLELDASELPTEFQVLSSAPTLRAWQYTGRDFTISTKLDWYAPGETEAQVVDFLKLSSQVSRDGEWATDVRMFVKSREGNALRVVLPEGVSLWEVRVDGTAANARQDGGYTLIPLPAGMDSKQAVEVSLRYGARAAKAERLTLAAPKLGAPVVISEWTVKGDEGRQLVPRGGNANLVKPALAADGFAWITRHRGAIILLGGFAVLATLLAAAGAGKPRQIIALCCGLVVILMAAGLALNGVNSMRSSLGELQYAAPVVPQEAQVVIEIGNLPPWRAHTNWGVWLLLAAGLGIMAHGMYRADRWRKVIGFTALGLGLLAIHGGVSLFFLLVVVAAVLWWLPRVWRLAQTFSSRVVAPTAAALLILTSLATHPAQAAEEPAGDLPAAESMTHNWQIANGRLRGTVDVVVRGETGARFLLLKAPAVLTGFEGDGLRLMKAPHDQAIGYFIVMEREGRLNGKAQFEMPLEDPTKGWDLPGGEAAMRQISVQWDKPGWDFTSPSAARIQPLPGLPATHSGSLMVINTDAQVHFQALARQRDVTAEETRFFAEVSNLYLPGPGVVNGRHLVAVRPAQGRVSALVLTVPEGFTVSDVTQGPIDSWRFDPGKRELRITITPAQAQAFELLVETQRGTDALPVSLTLDPLRIAGSAGELGFLAVACADDAQVESVEPEGLARVNAEDFGRQLLPKNKEGQPLVTLQHAYRYGAEKAVAEVKVAALAPELRAEIRQFVTMGDDRLLIETDLSVNITRAGVFRVQVELPEGLEIESVTGDGLAHWAESKPNGKRTLTLNLQQKSIGLRKFNLVLTSQSPGTQTAWPVPRLRVLDASRESGLLTIQPGHGMQVRVVDRNSVLQLDPKDYVEHAKGSATTDSRLTPLVYRLLNSGWSLKLAIGKLDPWITARVFHEATLREGQLLNRAVIAYHIENAAVKSLRVRIPGLDETATATVRANGADVADLIPVPGEAGLWEIRFQKGITRDTEVELQYQRRTVDHGQEQLTPIGLEDIRLGAYFTAIRTAGRLGLEPGQLPRGWQRTDWSVVQASLGAMAGNIAPLMCYRVADPEGPLPITLKQLELTNLQRLRVASGELTTLLAPGGQAMTAVDLMMEVSAKGTLVLNLPDKAELFNVLVNEEPANLVREGEGWQFHVFPSPQVDQPARVHFVYAAQSPAPLRLEGPQLNVPMENLTWKVLVPEGWVFASHKGDFQLKQQQALGSFGLKDYMSFSVSKRESDSQRASSLLAQANTYLKQGKQELASQALGNALRSNQLDDATNEDARVLEFKTKTDQTMLGLNTRRQRVQIDNRRNMSADFNERLDRAAAANPLMQGQLEFDPRKLDQLMAGNTSEEISAMREIAKRLVTQQLAAEAAPQALDVTLPQRGTVLTFGRSVQVDGNRMVLELKLKRQTGGFSLLALAICLAIGTLAAGTWRTPRHPVPGPLM